MAVKKRAKETSSPPSSFNSASSGPGSSSTKRSKDSGWPTWLWIVGGIGLLLCLGQVFAPAPEKKTPKGASKAPKGASKAAKREAPKPRPRAEKGSTMAYLDLAMRLAEMTQVATQMVAIGELDSEATKTLDAELTEMEVEIEGLDSAISRDLRAMVSVIRGTIYQQADNLTDEQVAKMENSYTYANPQYWDEYYKKTDEGERYDWYGSWDTQIETVSFTPGGSGEPLAVSNLGDMLKPYLKKEAKILMFGCGNSDMSEKMYKDGFENIVNIDISQKLIDSLKDRLQADMPNMRWQYANASALDFDAGSFDIVLDKGTFDAIEQNMPLLTNAAKEAHRVLKPDGLLLSVTFNDKAKRVEQQLGGIGSDWRECHEHTFDRVTKSEATKDGKVYFIHACSRH